MTPVVKTLKPEHCRNSAQFDLFDRLFIKPGLNPHPTEAHNEDIDTPQIALSLLDKSVMKMIVQKEIGITLKVCSPLCFIFSSISNHSLHQEIHSQMLSDNWS